MNFSINVSLKGKILNYEFLIGYNYKLEKLTLAHVLTEFISRWIIYGIFYVLVCKCGWPRYVHRIR